MRMKAEYLFVLAILAASCSKGELVIHESEELGAVNREVTVEAVSGNFDMEIYSNTDGNLTFSDDWLSSQAPSFSGDMTVSIDYTANSGFPRHGFVFLKTDGRRDTVTVYQKGSQEEIFHLNTSALIVYNGKSGVNKVPTEINVPLENIKVEVRYMNGSDWVKEYNLTSDGLNFTLEDNTDMLNMRRAIIALMYTDGWGEVQEQKVTIVQARADNSVGTEFTAEELRSVATVSGYELPEDAFFEGYIVGTTEDSNAGALEVADYRNGTGVVEYELDDCTNYIESLDGKYGFRMISKTAAENAFIRDTKVGLMLGGAVVKLVSSDPACYEINGVSSFNLLTASDEEPPKKEMSIEDITDDDIFTSITLKDCEIPMRKGPFTPINEGYGNLCGYNFFAKYPVLVRDREGGSTYMFVNVNCPWRRNGEAMPNGSGDIRCVVVNEVYKSFGDIGRYQIRALTREDIALAESFEDNFSGLISEFRWIKYPEDDESTSLPGAILATYGNGEMTHTYSGYTSSGVRFGNFSPSYFYLGPCGSKKKGHIENLAGIILEDGTSYNPIPEGKEADQNTDGKGWFAASVGLSWSNKYWWNDGRGYAFLAKFSTAGISSDHVSVQFAMYNNSQALGSPRYWKAQYSLTTSDCSEGSDDQWTDIGEFTVNDVAIWALRCDWQTLGTQVFDFPLPTDILGQENVYIRLMPRSNVAGKKVDDGYTAGTIANNSGYTTMDYFAIRYNK